jgi:hypothetical protein
MYLSAERLALANQAVRETFEQCSIVWQAIPHWGTGDPGQIRVADGKYNPLGFLPLLPQEKPFQVTLAQANAPTPNLLLTKVTAMTKDLAKTVDDDVLQKLYLDAAMNITTGITPRPPTREAYRRPGRGRECRNRAPSCLITNTEGLKIQPGDGVETLFDGGADGDVAEAEAAIERLTAAPADEGLVIREIWLLRLRALLAGAHGDAAAYAQFRDRYRDMARTLGFEGHIAWAEAMP